MATYDPPQPMWKRNLDRTGRSAPCTVYPPLATELQTRPDGRFVRQGDIGLPIRSHRQNGRATSSCVIFWAKQCIRAPYLGLHFTPNSALTQHHRTHPRRPTVQRDLRTIDEFFG